MDENSNQNCFLEKRFEFESKTRLNSSFSQMSDTFETSDETTLSLPSLSLQQNVSRSHETTDPRLVTIKESERLVNELKTENFNLKLRIYCLEKSNNNNNNLNQNENNEFSKELLKREKSLKTFSKLLNENKETVLELERKVKALSEENCRLAAALVSQKTSSESLSDEKTLLFQLMSHLFEFCQLFRGDPNAADVDDRRRNQQLCRLLNSSEDLLNCASILVTKSSNTNSGINALNFETSEESEDFWSEPDRQASRARIGLSQDDRRLPLSASRGRRRRRNQSVGISTQMLSSSLGLIDLNSDSKETEIQTDISFFTQNDKCCQTSDDDRRHPLSDVETEVFSEFEPKVKPKSQKRSQESPKSGQKSIYTYFASLSPLNKRTKETIKRSVSSSLSSVVKSEQTLSPDLGIETEVNDSCVRKVVISLKDFRRLKRFLNECLLLSKEEPIVSGLLENCVKCCERFSLEENLVKKLEKMRKSKESMEKAIQKQLNKTNELLIKTKENLE